MNLKPRTVTLVGNLHSKQREKFGENESRNWFKLTLLLESAITYVYLKGLKAVCAIHPYIYQS